MSKPPAPLSALRSKPPCSSSSSSSTYLLQSTCTLVFSLSLSVSNRGQNSSSLSFLMMWKCTLRSALAHTLILSSTSTSLKNSSSTSYFLPLLVPPEREVLVGELDLLVLDVRQVDRHVDRVLTLRPLHWRPESLRFRHACSSSVSMSSSPLSSLGYDSLPFQNLRPDPTRPGWVGGLGDVNGSNPFILKQTGCCTIRPGFFYRNRFCYRLSSLLSHVDHLTHSGLMATASACARLCGWDVRSFMALRCFIVAPSLLLRWGLTCSFALALAWPGLGASGSSDLICVVMSCLATGTAPPTRPTRLA